jgi:hypothetical protein
MSAGFAAAVSQQQIQREITARIEEISSEEKTVAASHL